MRLRSTLLTVNMIATSRLSGRVLHRVFRQLQRDGACLSTVVSTRIPPSFEIYSWFVIILLRLLDRANIYVQSLSLTRLTQSLTPEDRSRGESRQTQHIHTLYSLLILILFYIH